LAFSTFFSLRRSKGPDPHLTPAGEDADGGEARAAARDGERQAGGRAQAEGRTAPLSCGAREEGERGGLPEWRGGGELAATMKIAGARQRSMVAVSLTRR
jgi:hypothetical protein